MLVYIVGAEICDNVSFRTSKSCNVHYTNKFNCVFIFNSRTMKNTTLMKHGNSNLSPFTDSLVGWTQDKTETVMDVDLITC